MTNHVRPFLGFALSLTTAVLWGILPLFLAICLQAMDSATITVYRFIVAGVFVFAVLFFKSALPPIRKIGTPALLLCVAATVMLVINYVTNVIGLKYLSPGSVQVLMQIAPLALMIGGVLVYKEPFTRIQLFGTAVLLLGLTLFFNQRLPQIIASESEDMIGIYIIAGSALAWASYALCQKVLLRRMTAMQLTLFIYLLGALMLVPFSQFSLLLDLNAVQWWSLGFCCLNTIIAYGAFTEALRIWHASRVSAVIALAPIFTFLSMLAAEHIAPDWFIQPQMGGVAWIGAALVITGSIVTALGREKVNQ